MNELFQIVTQEEKISRKMAKLKRKRKNDKTIIR